MATPESKEKAFGRWWEYYFIRYFFGTIVGGVIIVILAQRSPAPLSNLVFTSANTKQELSLTAIAVLGLAYCYIASAPLLCLHAIRPRLLAAIGMQSEIQNTTPGISALGTRKWKLGLSPLILMLTELAGLCWLIGDGPRTSPRDCLALLALVLILVVEVGIIVKAQFDRFGRVTDFYWRLAKARSAEGNQADEYVESYRHLREHGNAYAIIFLEFAWAPILAAAKNQYELMVILILWVLPAAYCWLIATQLEANLPLITEADPSLKER